MRSSSLIGLAVIGCFLAGGARAQLVSESVEDMSRICLYSGTAGAQSILSGPSSSRSYRVGIGQNCPSTYPFVSDPGRPLPATAILTNEEQFAGGRRCLFREGGMEWIRYIAIEERCPLSAGLLPADILREAPVDQLPR